MHADSADLKLILESLWSTENPKTISRLLRVFSNRPLPQFDSRLIDLSRHNERDVRRAAFAVLSKNRHAAVRNLALELLATDTAGEVVELFVSNFETGDEHRILRELRLPEDLCQKHSLLMDVVKVLEANPEAACRELGLIAYFETPCQMCRFYAARLLYQQQVAPDWLVEECAFDAEEQYVELFAGSESN